MDIANLPRMLWALFIAGNLIFTVYGLFVVVLARIRTDRGITTIAEGLHDVIPIFDLCGLLLMADFIAFFGEILLTHGGIDLFLLVAFAGNLLIMKVNRMYYGYG